MPVLDEIVCTIARLEDQLRRPRRVRTDETLPATLQTLIQWWRGQQEQEQQQQHKRGREEEQRQQASWFSVFPGWVRPVSTTWPWTIKPALAVLWGVCWQYFPSGNFDSDVDVGTMASAGRTRVRATRLEGSLGLGWQAPDDGACEYSISLQLVDA